jgi:hypothetical protein
LRQERILELIAVFLLSVATLGIAWSGYQAAKWGGHQAREYADADTLNVKANRAATLAGQERIQDLLNFNRWLEYSLAGDHVVADLYARRFRQEFVPAFEAWLEDDPLNNPQAIATPLLEPEYRIANFAKADRHDRLSEVRTEEAQQATQTSDDYIFATVFFAAVLFFAAISMRFAWIPMRITVLILATLCLIYGVAHLVSQPTL